jgi:MFS family permease
VRRQRARQAAVVSREEDVRPQFLVVSQRLGAGRRDTDDRDALTLKQSLRTLTGIGLGAELTLVDTYLSELLPRRSRGRYVAWSYTIGLFALPVAGALATAANTTIAGMAGWRWLLILAAGAGRRSGCSALGCWNRHAGLRRPGTQPRPTGSCRRSSGTLVDVYLGAESGFELAEQLHRAGSPTPPPVILISSHSEKDFGKMIERSSAVGFLAKSALSQAAIRDLLDGRE